MSLNYGLKIYARISFQKLIIDFLKKIDEDGFLTELSNIQNPDDYFYSDSIKIYVEKNKITQTNEIMYGNNHIKILNKILEYEVSENKDFLDDLLSDLFYHNIEIPNEIRYTIFGCTTYRGSRQKFNPNEFILAGRKLEVLLRLQIFKENSTVYCQGICE